MTSSFFPFLQERRRQRGGKAISIKIKNKKELKVIRAKLRKNMPAPELILWQKIRSNALGTKFRRQFSINNQILDFYAPKAGLAIELDGESHFESRQVRMNDNSRDSFLSTKFGIKVLRFTNRDVMENLVGVLTKIQENLPPLHLPPSRSKSGQGEKGF